MEDNSTKPGLWQRMMARARYCISGVWDDNRDTWRVKAVKIANLSVRSYLDRDLQMRSCALTFKTVLAAVPALALLFAIGRGLGFQNLLTTQLFRYFPAQRQVLDTAFTFIDNYLAQASQGAFVGIGVVVLLWTVISLMSDIESTFNRVWGAKNGRPLRRKFTDYTALLLILPVLMICSAGVSIFMSNGVQRLLGDNFMSPVVQWVLSFTPIVLAWIVFTAAYYFIPNAKVRFKGALAAGILCGTLFHLVQWLFVSGQVYVSKYNAIYGSFAFLPRAARVATAVVAHHPVGRSRHFRQPKLRQLCPQRQGQRHLTDPCQPPCHRCAGRGRQVLQGAATRPHPRRAGQGL